MRTRSTFEAWEKIFQAKQFDVSLDLHYITADEIKAITSKEPRIMAKVDNSSDLPPALKKHGYFLLPVRNGKYAIVRGEGFHRLENRVSPDTHVSRIKFPLTTAARGMSEMQYLDFSVHAGALEAALHKDALYQSIRGREYTRAFSFNVGNTKLDTESVQIEVDSGLEGKDCIVLVEAKIDNPEDFIIRQLFYPYNHFKMVSPNKTIIPVFFTYEPTDKLYNYWIYEFTNPEDYNSIQLRETRTLFITTEQELSLEQIEEPEGAAIYRELVPQANDLDKVIELVFKVGEGVNNYRDIAQHFGFNERQSSYYREAAEALGLVIVEDGRYSTTEHGKYLIGLPTDKRNIFFVELLSGFNLIRASLDTLQKSGKLTEHDLAELIAKNSALSGTTIPRRAQSLKAWLKWMSETTGAFKFENNEFVPT